MKLEPANIVCPTCGRVDYMQHLIGKNVGYLNMKCINCNSYFNFDELYKRRIEEVLKPNPATNADRLRAKSNEELAEWLVMVERRVIENALSKPFYYTDEQLKADWLDWLKQEVDDG